ncbi:hypothetical protein P7C70_g7420, partial [Phenoliferia sp. Uapishka_3]
MSSSYDYANGRPSMHAPQQSPINFGNNEDDGFIMSAMSNSTWSGSPGYVKPGSYSTLPQPQQHQQPILRAGPAWGDQATVVQAPIVQAPVSTAYTSTPSSGFARVGGGRASSSNPYQLANSNSAATAYPPYPASSADLYSTGGGGGGIPGNPRRMSQSAVIEMASATDPAAAPLNSTTSARPRPPSLPSSSTLLSNNVKPYRTERRPSIVAVPSGFFGRFRKPTRKPSTEFSSDDDDSEDEARRKKSRGGWGLRFGGGRLGARNRAEEESVREEEEVEEGGGAGGGETGFVVTRKPRPPRASPGVSSGSRGSEKEIGGSGRGSGSGEVPRVSVEAPSQDGHGHGQHGGEDDEQTAVGMAA